MKNFSFLVLSLFSINVFGQYDGPAGTSGSLAIHKDSPLFVAWATGATVTRGLQDIANPAGGYASQGSEAGVPGPPDGSAVVSLGDGGNAVVTFAKPITNGPGADFAVFENAFNDTFLELAFVEVSSDGVNFFRFPAVSNTQTTTQTGGFGSVDATKLHNLAGKYKTLYGTPFDLDEVPDNPNLNKNAITHIKVIDVIGTIDPVYATYDSQGHIINELYNTPFPSGGFDLDAVGVIHQSDVLGTAENNLNSIRIYPNPTADFINISGVTKIEKVMVYDISGRLATVKYNDNKVDVTSLPKGNFILQIFTKEGISTLKFIKK